MSTEHDQKPESPTNIRLVHEDAIVPDSLYTKKPLHWFVGRNVKTSFQSADSRAEHMWVNVRGVEGDYLVGTLDNDPVWVNHLQHGDRVALRRTQIEAVDLTLGEWREEAAYLRARGDYFNSWLGYPKDGSGFEKAYEKGLTPRQALNRWH